MNRRQSLVFHVNKKMDAEIRWNTTARGSRHNNNKSRLMEGTTMGYLFNSRKDLFILQGKSLSLSVWCRVSAWIKNLLKFKSVQNSFKSGSYRKLIKLLKSLLLILCFSHPVFWYVLFPTIDAVTKLVPPPCCNYKPVTLIQLMLQLIDYQWLAHLCTCPPQTFWPNSYHLN
jgi:hypothetical protein